MFAAGLPWPVAGQTAVGEASAIRSENKHRCANNFRDQRFPESTRCGSGFPARRASSLRLHSRLLDCFGLRRRNDGPSLRFAYGARPGAAIQRRIEFVGYLDCFAGFTPAPEPGLAMTILPGSSSFSAACPPVSSHFNQLRPRADLSCAPAAAPKVELDRYGM